MPDNGRKRRETVLRSLGALVALLGTVLGLCNTVLKVIVDQATTLPNWLLWVAAIPLFVALPLVPVGIILVVLLTASARRRPIQPVAPSPFDYPPFTEPEVSERLRSRHGVLPPRLRQYTASFADSEPEEHCDPSCRLRHSILVELEYSVSASWICMLLSFLRNELLYHYEPPLRNENLIPLAGRVIRSCCEIERRKYLRVRKWRVRRVIKGCAFMTLQAFLVAIKSYRDSLRGEESAEARESVDVTLQKQCLLSAIVARNTIRQTLGDPEFMTGVFRNMVPLAFGFSLPRAFPSEAREIAKMFYDYITAAIKRSGPKAIVDDFCMALTQSGGAVMLARHFEGDSICDLIVVPAWNLAQSIADSDIAAGGELPSNMTYEVFHSLKHWVEALLENPDVSKSKWPMTLAGSITEWMDKHQAELHQGYVNIRFFCERIVRRCRRESRSAVDWSASLVVQRSEQSFEIGASLRNISKLGACLFLPKECYIDCPRMEASQFDRSVYALTVSTPKGPLKTSRFDLKISRAESDASPLSQIPESYSNASIVWWRPDPAGLVCGLRFSSSAPPPS